MDKEPAHTFPELPRRSLDVALGNRELPRVSGESLAWGLPLGDPDPRVRTAGYSCEAPNMGLVTGRGSDTAGTAHEERQARSAAVCRQKWVRLRFYIGAVGGRASKADQGDHENLVEDPSSGCAARPAVVCGGRRRCRRRPRQD